MADDWYVGIFDFGFRSCYPFYGVGSESYRDFKQIAERHGAMKIVAEVFGVSDDNLERASESGLLRQIADRLEKREQFDVQKELERACGVTPAT